MRFSLNWLKNHLSTQANIYQIAEKLTSIGLEVEFVKDPDAIFKNFKLVEIETAEKHPNADKLKVCTVKDFENNKMTIVCGAKNARVGLKTVLAMPGAIIPSTNDVLKKGKIRGIESEGMMCSYTELAIKSAEPDFDGIIEISANLECKVGDALGYDGGVIDIAITPNRGDCFSINGIARDLCAAGVGEFLEYEHHKKSNEKFNFFKQNFKHKISYKNVKTPPVKIDFTFNLQDEICPFIKMQSIKNVKNTKSPQILRQMLESAGINSISLLVDLANWWMLDSGQPLHVYDLGKIRGNLVMRYAKNGEKFIDIKGNEHTLSSDMMVAADDKNILCVLGIMGGQAAMCDENTTDILIEAAVFDPVSISTTGSKLNLLSDARTRAERGIDCKLSEHVLNYMTESVLLMNEENCDIEVSDIEIFGMEKFKERIINLKQSKIISIIGYEIDFSVVKNIMKKLGLNEVTNQNNDHDEISFAVPSWRSDLNIPEDLVEEILRIIGYDNIIEQNIESVNINHDFNTSVHKSLAANGMSEIISYAFINEKLANLLSEGKELIRISNPINVDLNVMRTNLLTSLLLAGKRGLNVGEANIALFESGSIFYKDLTKNDSHIFAQEKHFAGLRIYNSTRHWLYNGKKGVYDIKKDAFIALANYGIFEKDVKIHCAEIGEKAKNGESAEEIGESGDNNNCAAQTQGNDENGKICNNETKIVAKGDHKNNHKNNNKTIDKGKICENENYDKEMLCIEWETSDTESKVHCVGRDKYDKNFERYQNGNKFTFCQDIPSYYHPLRSGAIEFSKNVIGYFGQLHPKVNKFFDIKEPILVFELLMDKIVKKKQRLDYNDKVFPKVYRDFAFLFDAKQNVGNLINAIYKIDSKIIEVTIFDIFQIDEGQKSVAFSVVLGRNDCTLNEQESIEISNKIINHVEKTGGKLRSAI